MNPCRNCGEDVGDASECPNCGRRQYRFAVEDDTTIPPERTEALEDVEDLLRERIDPPPRRREAPLEWQPPPEPDQPPPEPDHGSMPTGEPAPQQDEHSAPGCLWTLFLVGLGSFFTLPIIAVLQAEDSGAQEILVFVALFGTVAGIFYFSAIRAWIRRMRGPRRGAPHEWQPPPEPDHDSMPTGEPAPQQDERTRPGWGWTLLLPTVVPALAANFMDGIGVPDPVGTVLADLLLIVLLFIVIRAWIRWKRQER